MPKAILPSQLTEEEILAMLASEDDEVVPKAEIFDYSDDIVPFLSFYNITPGKTQVSKKLLYKLYKTHSKNPVPELNFNTVAGRYVEGTRNHYLLNTDNFIISQHIYTAEKTRDKTKSLTYQKHFDWFMEQRGVERGVSWVEGFILFYIYKDFCRSRKVKPKLGYVNFHKFLKLHFRFKRMRENRSLWFSVDYKTANILTETEQGIIRDARTKETGRSKEESKSGTEEVPSV